jgi:ABC-type phosphonate transport system ATPase subunit
MLASLVRMASASSRHRVLLVVGESQTGKKTLLHSALGHLLPPLRSFYLDFGSKRPNLEEEALRLSQCLAQESEDFEG